MSWWLPENTSSRCSIATLTYNGSSALCHRQFLCIFSRLHRRFIELEIRRGFTTFQLMTILEEAHHSLIIIEHDPVLYKDSLEMVEYVSQAMRQASHEATVLLYSPGIDSFLEELAKDADRVFYFE
jgi:hypothetical protein